MCHSHSLSPVKVFTVAVNLLCLHSMFAISFMCLTVMLSPANPVFLSQQISSYSSVDRFNRRYNILPLIFLSALAAKIPTVVLIGVQHNLPCGLVGTLV